MNFEYYYLFIFFLISIVLSLLIFTLSWVAIFKNYDVEKLSSYECGFQPYSDSRSKFDIKFYLVAILFIIFDLEIAFLFPWSVFIHQIGLESFWSMFIFLIILGIGFFYEWMKGALDWD